MRILHIFSTIIIGLLFSFELSAQCPTRENTPIPSFKPEDINICAGRTVKFLNNSNTKGNSCYFVWDWADGTRDTTNDLSPVTHIFTRSISDDCSKPSKKVDITLFIYVRGCNLEPDKQLSSFNISFPPIPKFTLPAVICLDNPEVEPINITCPANDPDATLIWRIFEKGTNRLIKTYTEKNPRLRFEDAGQYDVELEVTNLCGTAIGKVPINVESAPAANAEVKIDAGSVNVCAPYEATLTSTSTGATGQSWSISPRTGWKYINGTSASSPVARVRFEKNGEYTLKLKINTVCGDREADLTQKIIVKSKPEVEMDTLIGSCRPFTIAPTATVKNDGDLPLTYEWSIAGGSIASSTNQAPGNITFANLGKFPITFKAKNACGVDSVTRYLEVRDKITVFFPTLKDTLCNTGDKITLTALPEGGKWSGTGITEAGVFDPSVSGIGTYRFTYLATFGSCSDSDSKEVQVFGTTANAGAPQATCGNDPTLVNLMGASPAKGWWKGKGVTDSLGKFDPSVSGTGDFDVTYFYRDSVSGCVNSAAKKITVHTPPKAIIDTLKPICINTETLFKHQSLRTEAVRWSFGDGQESANAQPVYRYAKGGSYAVQLLVTSAENCRDTARAVQIVSEPVSVAFDQDKKEGCSPLIVNLTNKNIVPLANYRWTFGNGETSTEAQPAAIQFINNSFGDTTFRVKLEAITPGCPQSQAESAVTIYVGVKARFEPDLKVGCAPHKVTFSNVSIGAPRTFEWDFGNGIKSSEEFPTPQTYTIDSTAKTYRIRLVATNYCGSDTTFRDVTATPANVKAFFGIDRIEGCSPLSINVASAATNGSQITYTLGDGNTVTTPNFMHVYTKPGTYEIMQKASGSCGVDQTKRTVTVWETPSVDFTAAQFNICKDRRVKFQQKISPEEVAVRWDFGNGKTSGEYNPTHDYGRSGDFKVKLIAETTRHGCRGEDSTIINVRSPLKFGFDSVRHSGCFGINTGAIVIQRDDISGGLPTYEFSLNDSSFAQPTVSGIFTALEGRKTHTIWIRDQAGCIDSASAYVKGLPSLNIDAGQDREIDLGDSTRTFVTTNSFRKLAIKWTPAKTIDCDSCQEIIMRPLETTTYTVTATGPDGCTESDRLTVRVVSNRKIYVPNVFSPDDNGANDVFFPYSGKNIRTVRYFRVFNRWGEMVFENKNFMPNNEQDGWDGRHNGDRAKEDVYVWTMEIELLNGLIEQFKGDVTLLR